MVAYATTGGYGSPKVQGDGSGLVDTEEGIPVVAPVLIPGDGSGQIVAASIDPTLQYAPGMPIQNAILIELKVLNELMAQFLGTQAPDLRALRADLAFNMLTPTGVA